MNPLVLLSVFLALSVPVYAKGAQSDSTNLSADAQKVVSIIRHDKAKTQTYCIIRDLTDEVEQEENLAKASELSERINNLEEKLGPEFTTLVRALADISPNSQDKIRSILEALEELGLATPAHNRRSSTSDRSRHARSIKARLSQYSARSISPRA